MPMKRSVTVVVLIFAAVALAGFVANGVRAQGGKTLTKDPLTGLPIIASEDKFHLGNEPTVIDTVQMCKSNMKSEMYSLSGIKMNASAAWYESKLPGFKKTEGWKNRTTITFYKPDGTVSVSLTGHPAPQGQDTDVYAISYATFTPGFPEKAFAGIATGNLVCN
jgi:hypothetical protein